MAINVAKEVATLRYMTVSELRDRYHEVFGEDTNTRNKQWLIKRIAWKLQASAEGDFNQLRSRLTGGSNARSGISFSFDTPAFGLLRPCFFNVRRTPREINVSHTSAVTPRSEGIPVPKIRH